MTTTFLLETLAIAYTIYTTNTTDFTVFIAMFAVTALAVKATTWFCNTVVHDFVSGYVLRDAPFNHPLKKAGARTKFVGTAWQFVIHASMALFEIYVLHDEDWLSKPWLCFYPNPEDFTPKTSLRLLFVTQMAIWIFTCFSHRFNSDAHAHKDYFVMYIHHLATIGLVGLAYADNNFKIGTVVLFAHDVSDIGIDTLKMSNYLRLDGKPGLFIVELAYTMTMVMWVYFRLYLFPVYIIAQGSLASAFTSTDYLFPDGTRPLAVRMVSVLGEWTPAYMRYYFSCVTCNVLLIVLFILHIWWFALLFRILLRMLRSVDPHSAGADEYEGNSDREDDDDDEEEGEAKVTGPATEAIANAKPEVAPSAGASKASGSVSVAPAKDAKDAKDAKADKAAESSEDEMVSVGLPTRRKLGSKINKTAKKAL